MIPFIDLARGVRLIQKEVYEDWQSSLDRCEFVGGPSVQELERRLSERLKAPHVISCANGTDAILIALQALGVKPGDRVALPNLTFWATYEAVAQLGAKPVLIDIDPQDLQMDFEQFKKAHAQFRFRHALLVHLYGWASSRLMDFRRYCKEHSIHLVEDGAQSFGVKQSGISIYAEAEVSTLSFYPAKVMGGCMDGGAITAQDAEVARRLRSLCNHGRSAHYSYEFVGWNSRMSGINARFLLRMLDHASSIVEERARAEQRYRELLLKSSIASKIRLFGPPSGISGNGYLSVIELLADDPARVSESLKALGVGSGRVYPETLDQQPPASAAERFGALERSRAFCKGVLCLPLFWKITDDEIERSVRALERVLGA